MIMRKNVHPVANRGRGRGWIGCRFSRHCRAVWWRWEDLEGKKLSKETKLELKASQAEELRLNSLETFGQTKSRKGEESSSKEPKNQWSSNDMIGFLREKNAQKNNFRP